MSDILLGCHIGMHAPDYLVDSVHEAISYGCNCFMIYTGAPQSSVRVDLSKLRINEYLEILKQNNIDSKNVIIHAPYIINLGSNNPVKKNIGKSVLAKEIYRTDKIGSKYLVLHPGFATDCSRQEAISNIANSINELLTKNNNVVICLETMAGKGSEIGKDFNELHSIIELINKKDQIGVCFDTCHVNDSGIDISKIDEVLNQFDKVIGLKYLKVIHLNDSINDIGAHKDRHENIGYGKIGFNTLYKWTINPKLVKIPKILETPWCGDQPIYKQEIQMLRTNKWFDVKKNL